MFENGIIGHDPDLARSILGSFIRFLRWIAALYAAATLIMHQGLDPLRLAGPFLVFAGTILFQRTLARGRMHLTCVLTLLVVYLAMLPRLFAQGISSPVSFLALASIPLSALLLGIRVGIGYALLDFATFGCVLLLESSGRIVASPAADPFSWTLIGIVVALAVVGYQSIAVDGQRSALGMANREREELDRVIAQSERENRDLEEEVKRRTEGLSEANESTTRFSASLSHDLRAPLRSIGGFAKALSEEDVPDSVLVQLQGIVSDAASLDLVLEKTMLNLRRENGR